MAMRLDNDHDGTPQPCSQPMDYTTAQWYVQHSHGQLQCYLHKDGQWYLYDARTPPLGVAPKIPVNP